MCRTRIAIWAVFWQGRHCRYRWTSGQGRIRWLIPCLWKWYWSRGSSDLGIKFGLRVFVAWRSQKLTSRIVSSPRLQIISVLQLRWRVSGRLFRRYRRTGGGVVSSGVRVWCWHVTIFSHFWKIFHHNTTISFDCFTVYYLNSTVWASANDVLAIPKMRNTFFQKIDIMVIDLNQINLDWSDTNNLL